MIKGEFKMVKVYNNFLNHQQCKEILDYATRNFEIDKRTYSGWHAKTNRNTSFQTKIKELITNIVPYKPFHIVWINLTEYENNRSLAFHTDERSDFTFTIPLTDGYIGGDFLIEENVYKLSKGDCISFNGFKLKHGVSSVVEGYRASLNVWIKKGSIPII